MISGVCVSVCVCLCVYVCVCVCLDVCVLNVSMFLCWLVYGIDGMCGGYFFCCSDTFWVVDVLLLFVVGILIHLLVAYALLCDGL